MTVSVPPDRALVIGEALIDVVDRADRSDAHVGGSPLNVAVGLARLGVDVVFATEFSDDAHGRLIDDHLRSAEVAWVQTTSSREPTSTARARIGRDGSASYVFDLRWVFDAPPRTDGFSVVHVGSVGALRPPGALGVIDLVESLPSDVLVTFDPNIRPALLPPREQTRELVERFAARANLVKLSDEDAEWLYPEDPSVAPARLLAQGASIVAVTRGAAGSDIHTEGRSVTVPPYRTEVADTIGAGDAYMSGLVGAIVRGGLTARVIDGAASGADLTAIGGLAAVAAGLTVGRAGAVPPTEDEIAAVAELPWARVSTRG